jgi:hypothetical protein
MEAPSQAKDSLWICPWLHTDERAGFWGRASESARPALRHSGIGPSKLFSFFFFSFFISGLAISSFALLDHDR